MSTRVPKGYLIVDSAPFGNSGQALLQQFKPFGRGVYADQSDFLKELTLKIKMHLAITNKFQGWDTPFELIMQFPVIEESTERQQKRSEEINMTNTALTVLKDLIGADKIPPDIVKDAFSTMTSIPQEKVVRWVDDMEAERKRAEAENPKKDDDEDEDESNLFEKVAKRYTDKIKDKFKEEMIKVSAKYFPESLTDGRHIRSSLLETNDMRDQRKMLALGMNYGLKSNSLKEMLQEAQKEHAKNRIKDD